MKAALVQVRGALRNTILRQRARPLASMLINRAGTQRLFDDMLKTLDKDGAGLAAPQIGQSLRVFIMAPELGMSTPPKKRIEFVPGPDAPAPPPPPAARAPSSSSSSSGFALPSVPASMQAQWAAWWSSSPSPAPTPLALPPATGNVWSTAALHAAAEPLVVINPRIEAVSTATDTAFEGCLSIPGYRGKVTRASHIRVSFTDRHAREHRNVQFDDFYARVFQHEYDHLNGVLYIDRLHGLERLPPYSVALTPPAAAAAAATPEAAAPAASSTPAKKPKKATKKAAVASSGSGRLGLEEEDTASEAAVRKVFIVTPASQRSPDERAMFEQQRAVAEGKVRQVWVTPGRQLLPELSEEADAAFAKELHEMERQEEAAADDSRPVRVLGRREGRTKDRDY